MAGGVLVPVPGVVIVVVVGSGGLSAARGVLGRFGLLDGWGYFGWPRRRRV
jgi:hypothetical protein